VARIYEALEEEGIPADQLQRVHAPVGLNLGAVTPQEIAVSILAELIGVKYGKIGADATTDADQGAESLRWAPPSTAQTTPA
jgi:xanthine dehydrogenase accessory factor